MLENGYLYVLRSNVILMIRFLTLFGGLFLCGTLWAQPCTTTNAAGCDCADGSTQCDLLPDITISWYALENYQNGPTEYSQTGNGANNGRLRVTGSTPNTGHGPLTVRGTDYFLCGTDTIYDPTRSITTCPNGDFPTNLLQQRIYRKDGANMTYYDRWAGGQTYHPTHGHNHVDDWVTFTLRREDPSEPDTLQWPIIGVGSKIGFCLMDLSNCNSSNGDCRDVQTYGQGTILTSSMIPNYGLGGGSYNCSPVEQGISVGYVDIYTEGLEGMWIDIPPGTCNGDYWIVVEVDPLNSFLESNEDNNWTAIPFTLTKQVNNGQASASVTLSDDPFLCTPGATITLSAATADTYLWSTGDTTASIEVDTPGDYFVDITSPCGNGRSDTITISSVVSAVLGTIGDTLCEPNFAAVQAFGTGDILWYTDAVGGFNIGAGNDLQTLFDVTENTTYYAANRATIQGGTAQVGPASLIDTFYEADVVNIGVIFDVLNDVTLKSVAVQTAYPGLRTIELRDGNGTVLADTAVYINSGASRVGLNFALTPGVGFFLSTNDASNQTVFGTYSPQLAMSVTGVAYPYSLPGWLQITGSPFGTNYYCYFYDWELEMPPYQCYSARVPVNVLVSAVDSLVIDVDTLHYLDDTAASVVLQPEGGVLTGPGVEANGQGYAFNPNTAGVGDAHELTYTYTDLLGCLFTRAVTLKVVERDTGSVGLTTMANNTDWVRLFPNPTNGQLTVELDAAYNGNTQVRVLNMLGEELITQQHTTAPGLLTLNLSELTTGLYLVDVVQADKHRVFKVIRE